MHEPATGFPKCAECGALCPEPNQLSPAIVRRLGQERKAETEEFVSRYGSLPSRWSRGGRGRCEKVAEVWLAEGAEVVSETVARFRNGLTWDELRNALSRFCWGNSQQPKCLRLYLQRCVDSGRVVIVVSDDWQARYCSSTGGQ